MATTQNPVPSGLKRMLVDFTISVMVERPHNLLAYASSYFSALKKRREITPFLLAEEEEGEEGEDGIESSDFAVDKSGEPIKTSINEATWNPPPIDIELLRKFPILKSIDESAFQIIVSNMRSIPFKRGDTIVQQGTLLDRLYVIERGNVYLFNQEKLSNYRFMMERFQGHGYFGETALIENKPFNRSAIAKTRGLLRTVHKDVFDSYLKPSILQKRNRYSDLLKKVRGLKFLKAHDLHLICDGLEELCLQSGEVILKENDVVRSVYFIESGKVDIYSSSDVYKKKTIGLSRGWFATSVHWFGGLHGDPCEFTAIAAAKVTLAVLNANVFDFLPRCEGLKYLSSKLKKCKF